MPEVIQAANPDALIALAAELDAGRASKGKSGTRTTTKAEPSAELPKAEPSVKATLDAISDDDLLTWARHAKNGPNFIALYDSGDTSGYPSESEAVEALLVHEAYWTGGDAVRMERLFDGSALGRSEKWKARADYRRKSIDSAIRFNGGKAPDLAEFDFKDGIVVTKPKAPPKRPRWENANGDHRANGNGRHKPGDAAGAEQETPHPESGFSGLADEDLGIVPLTSVQCAAIRWLWEYRLARGGLAMLAGDGGIGKSLLLLWIVAAVTKGLKWADGRGTAPIGDVIIVSAEDRADDTIKPRLIAMGADISRVTIVKAKFTIRREGKPAQVHPASFQDRPYWREVFRRRSGCVLFIVDPLPSYLGRGVNDSKNIEIRAVLEPFLDEIIAPLDICMIGNTHLNKTVDAKMPIHRIAGSIAYGNLPRNVHFVVRDPDDPARRFFKQAKSNNSPDDLPALAFRVERQEITSEKGETIETAVPVFEAEPVALDLGDAVNGTKRGKRGPEAKQTTAVAEWLHDYLKAEGTTPLFAIFNAAGAKGYAGKQDEKGRWSNIGTLYRAMEHIPELQESRAGKRVEEIQAEVKAGGKRVKHWYLCNVDSF